MAVRDALENEKLVRLSYADGCGVDADATLSRPELLARLEDARGLRSLVEGDVEQSVAECGK